MEKSVFEGRLLKASEEAFILAKDIITEQLSTTFRYIIVQNQSNDSNSSAQAQIGFRQELIPANPSAEPLSSTKVAGHLWRDSKIPEWIDISVDYTNSDFTCMVLRCCAKYSSIESPRWTLSQKDLAPFSLRYPKFPKGWRIMENGIPNIEKSVEVNSKFSLYERNGIYRHRPSN